MPKASSLRVDSFNNFLFKGGNGFGKTIAAATFAVLGPIWIAYFDKKKPVELLTHFTPERYGKELAYKILDNITYEVYGAPNANEYLNKLMDFQKDCRYSAIITDSVTTLTASAVNWSLSFKDAKRQSSNELSFPDFDEYKVETSYVAQALDLCKALPCHNIWIAHPLPGIKIEGSGKSIKITKTNPIVTYGSKVAGMIPGAFTEIYHFAQESKYEQGAYSKRYIVHLDAVGDDYAKSPLLGDFVKELDITNKLFYNVWKETLGKRLERLENPPDKIETSNPFAHRPDPSINPPSTTTFLKRT